MTDSDKPNLNHSRDKTSAIPDDRSADTETSSSSYAELLENAKRFLQDESISKAPREQQITFLEKKGVRTADIEKLLHPGNGAESGSEADLKTIHDSTSQSTNSDQTAQQAQRHNQTQNVPVAIPGPRDGPPIITYPEFLLKPQKPPPLVTLQRLLYAGYGFAGLAALTYGASKYLVDPLLQSLNEARHELADKALEELRQLNDKLESSVSHVPYSASLAALKAQHEHDDDDEDSIDSDPTELFHRDIATQTSPQRSRSSSMLATGKATPFEVTDRQTRRLTSLHQTLESLVSSVDPSNDPFLPPTSTKKLHDTVSQVQSILDKLESTYDPFRSDYNNIYTSLSTKAQTPGRGDNNEAAKFKAEIRSLKGAFLSSRNFPAARPAGYNTTNVR